jgi:hypothetical protein
MLAMSPPKAWAFSEGRFCASAWIRSGWPVRASEVASSTWIGEALFSTFRPDGAGAGDDHDAGW